MKLTPNIAQTIVNKIMNLIHYNINIVDEKGVIIASGDQSRLNTYHEGAGRVLEGKKPIEITKGNIEYLSGSKEGINFPIFLNDKIVGVVGITGNPEEVRIYGAMVQAMVELMLQEAFYWEQVSLKNHAKFSLLNDLIHQDSDTDHNLLRARADILSYNLDLPRLAIVFKVNNDDEQTDNSSSSLDEKVKLGLSNQYFKKIAECLYLTSQDLFTAGIEDKYVLLKNVEKDKVDELKKYLQTTIENFKLSNLKLTVGIGKKCVAINQIPDSFAKALQALEVGSRLFGIGKIYHTEELGLEKFIDKVGRDFRQNFSTEIINKLKTKDNHIYKQLLQTAKIFLDSNLQIGEAAGKLFIHRNTLSYRLNKIRERTSLDLTCLDDAIKFKLALFCRQYDNEDIM